MSRSRKTFVVCSRNDGYEVSLEPRKVYVALLDDEAARHGHIRLIDEPGEDYLFPASSFIAAALQ